MVKRLFCILVGMGMLVRLSGAIQEPQPNPLLKELETAIIKGERESLAASKAFDLMLKIQLRDLNNFAFMERLLKLRTYFQSSALHYAAATGSVGCVDLLIKKGADIQVKDKSGQTALHYAAAAGSVGCVDLLIKRGADIQVKDKRGQTAFHSAALIGRTQVVVQLCQEGADLYVQNNKHQTPLDLAIENKKTGTVALLQFWQAIESKSLLPEHMSFSELLAFKDPNDHTVLYYAIQKRRTDLVKQLLDYDATLVNKPNIITGATPLHDAVHSGFDEIVALLLEKGADMWAKDIVGKTPLDRAFNTNNSEVVKLFELWGDLKIVNLHKQLDDDEISVSVDQVFKTMMEARSFLLPLKKIVPLKGSHNRTALHYAAESGNELLVWLLLDAGSDLTAQDDDGNTALHVAVDKENIDIVGLLLNRWGALVAQDPAKNNLFLEVKNKLLFCALAKKNDELAKLLLDKGASLDARDPTEQTPLHVALRYDRHAIVKLLLNKGASCDAEDTEKWTPLHVAALYNNKEIVQLLLEHGAKREAKNVSGETPFDVARRFGNFKITPLLNPQVKPVVYSGGNEYVPTSISEAEKPRGLIIIIDNLSSINADLDKSIDVLRTDLAIAIAQRAAPIIVARPILYDFLWAQKKICEEPASEQQKEQRKHLFECIDKYDRKMVDQVKTLYEVNTPVFNKCKWTRLLTHETAYLFSKIQFDDTTWNAYFSSGSNFYLLIPKTMMQEVQDGFDTRGGIEIATLKKEASSREDIPVWVSDITDFLKPNTGNWSVYLDGHGQTNKAIAGLSIDDFGQLLNFFSTRIVTSFLFYSTCFGGGINSVIPYQKMQRKLLSHAVIPFPIASQATTELSAHGTGFSTDLFSQLERRFNPYAHQTTTPPGLEHVKVDFDFVGFFEALQELFFKRNERIPETKPRTIRGDPWRYILSMVAPVRVGYEATDTPLLRFPGTDFFQATELGEEIVTLTTTRARMAEIEGCDIVLKGRKALLLYPHTIQMPVRFEDDLPETISMNPEAAAHIFTKIQAPEYDFQEIIKSFLKGVDDVSKEAPTKLFFLKDIECKESAKDGLPGDVGVFKNVLIKRSLHSVVLAQGNDGKHYFGSISKDSAKLMFVSVKEAFYREMITVLLEQYGNAAVRMREGKMLIAPWQIEPKEQAEKIAEFLGIKLNLVVDQQEEEFKKNIELIKSKKAQTEPKSVEEKVTPRISKQMILEALARKKEKMRQEIENLKKEEKARGASYPLRGKASSSQPRLVESN